MVRLFITNHKNILKWKINKGRKRVKKEIVIIILLVVCVLGLGGFVIYDKVLKEEEVVENKENDSTLENIDESNKLENAKKEILLFVHNIATRFDGTWFPSVDYYDREISNHNVLSNEFMEVYLLSFLNNYEKNWCFTDPSGSSNTYAVKTEEFKKVYKELWNKDVTFENSLDEEIVCDDGKTYDKEKYTLFSVYVGEQEVAPRIELNDVASIGADNYIVYLDFIYGIDDPQVGYDEVYFDAQIHFQYAKDIFTIEKFEIV